MTLTALQVVDTGSEFRIIWDGPVQPGDRIAIRPVGGNEGSTISTMPAVESVLNATAPDVPGLYEIVYLDGNTSQPLTMQGLEVR